MNKTTLVADANLEGDLTPRQYVVVTGECWEQAELFAALELRSTY